MQDDRDDWNDRLVEFVQAYDDGCKVRKRALEAAPMVARKYGLGPEEVMAFSSWDGRRKPVTVFHFDPGFPVERREAYMRAHDEAHQLVLENQSPRQADLRARALRAGRMAGQATRQAARTVNALVLAAVVAVIHGQVK